MKCKCVGCKNAICKCISKCKGSYGDYTRIWPPALIAVVLITTAYLLPPGIIQILFGLFGIGFLGAAVLRLVWAAIRWLFPFK